MGRRHRAPLTVCAVLVAALIFLPLATLTLGTYAGAGLADLLYGLVVFGLRLVPLLVVLAAAVGGLVLVADDLRGRFGLTALIRTPWQRLAGRAERSPGAVSVSPWRGLMGLALIAFAAFAGLLLASVYFGGGALVELLVLLAVDAAALAVLVTPVLIAALARADRGHAARARTSASAWPPTSTTRCSRPSAT